MSATELISLGELPTLPATADTVLLAGWIGTLSAGESFPVLTDTGTGGITVEAASSTSGQTAWTIEGRDSGGLAVFTANVSTTPDFRAGWHTYAISIDISTKTIQILSDETLFSLAATAPGVVWSSTNPIAFFPGSDQWFIGPVNDPSGSGYGVDLADFRFGAGEPFFDLSDPANVAKLFGLGNTPVYWGQDGSFVTGLPPAVDLSGTSGTYENNIGTGGAFAFSGDPPTDVPGPIGTVPSPTQISTGGSGPTTGTVPTEFWFQAVSVGGKIVDLAVDWDGNYEICDVQAPVPLTFQSNFAGSPTPGCDVAPIADVTLIFEIISAGVPTTIGALNFAAGSTAGGLATPFSPGGFTVFTGSRLRLYAPPTVDTTIAGIFATLVATR